MHVRRTSQAISECVRKHLKMTEVRGYTFGKLAACAISLDASWIDCTELDEPIDRTNLAKLASDSLAALAAAVPGPRTVYGRYAATRYAIASVDVR